MSVTIRLSRTGRKNLPSYRIVAVNTRDKRDGRALELLGFYNPSSNPAQLKYDEAKLNDWKSKGALVSDAVQKLLDGKYLYTPYRKAAKKGETAEKAEATEEQA